MKTNSSFQIGTVATMVAALLTSTAVGALAQQQTTGTPGSPSATTTIDGRYLSSCASGQPK